MKPGSGSVPCDGQMLCQFQQDFFLTDKDVTKLISPFFCMEKGGFIVLGPRKEWKKDAHSTLRHD